MLEVTLFANLFLLAVSSASVLVAVVLYLLYRRKESLFWALIMGGVLLLTTGKVVFQIASEVLRVADPSAHGALWLREAWFTLGRSLIILCLPQFLRFFGPRRKGGWEGGLWAAGLAWTALAAGWLVWYAFEGPTEARMATALGLMAAFSVLILLGALRFAQQNWRSSDRFLKGFGALLAVVSFLILALTLAKNYFGLQIGAAYDVAVNSLYVVLFAASGWYSFRGLRTMALPRDDQPVAARLERFGLSTRELEIARLVVEGQSNQEIAGALFISPKTVENHLYRIYQKAGINNRVQLYRLFRT